MATKDSIEKLKQINEELLNFFTGEKQNTISSILNDLENHIHNPPVVVTVKIKKYINTIFACKK